MLRPMADGGGETLEGTLDKIVFQNPSSQWTVARLLRDGGGPPVTVVGALLGVQPGTPLVLRGAWVTDKKYGEQFKVEAYHPRTPATAVGIEKYLGSGLVPGIGPELAKRIVARFGVDTLDVIGGQPTRLTEVEGIGPSRARRISAAWVAQKDIQDVMVFLRGHGVAAGHAVRIYKRYGKDAIGLIRANPYRLAIDIWGIGFKTADGIARQLGMAMTAPERLEAGLVHVLGELADDGHCHAPEETLIDRTAELLAVDLGLLAGPLERLAASGLVVRETLGTTRAVSLHALWEAETTAAQALAALADGPARPAGIDVEAALAAFEAEAGFALAPAQRRAVLAATRDKLVVITGGPGVGKTTIVKAVVTLARAAQRAIALAAPTGRAAKRLAEATGLPAVTLHRLLEFQPQSGRFQRDAAQPLDADLVVIDEASMIDVGLCRALAVALPPRARLVLVGDIDQLPSVGPGAVLGDVIRSGRAAVVSLDEIFRQAAASRIVTSAHRINRGELPELEAPAGDDARRSDFYFVEREEPSAAQATLLDLVAERIPKRFGFDPITEIQVLAPMHRGELGTMALNKLLQDRLNPAGGRELTRGGRSYRIGDKVMQIKNDHDREVYNGDLGVVRGVEDDALLVELSDGRAVPYEASELDELTHAYAISVHKSQGSEYPCVVVPLLTQHYLMLQRNLLYTAVTRGKRLVVLLGSRRAVGMAVKNGEQGQRFTWLADRLRRATAGPR
jgi:exodeoxyribonuclease V alpha subunit